MPIDDIELLYFTQMQFYWFTLSQVWDIATQSLIYQSSIISGEFQNTIHIYFK